MQNEEYKNVDDCQIQIQSQKKQQQTNLNSPNGNDPEKNFNCEEEKLLTVSHIERDQEKNQKINKTNLSGNSKSNNSNDSNYNSFPKNSKFKYNSIDDIIDKGGYTLLTLKQIYLTFMFFFCEGFILSYFGFILQAFKSYHNCSDLTLQVLSGLNFLGMGTGSLVTGFLTNRFSRIIVIKAAIISMLIFHLCLSLIENLIVFGVCRFFIAFDLGLLVILNLNILTEYLPMKLRSFMLNAVWFAWGCGAIFSLLMYKIFIPSLEFHKFNPQDPNRDQNFYKAILQFYLILVVIIISTFLFLRDSPRNLILTEKYKEAREILDYNTNNELTDEEFENIKLALNHSGENKFYEKQNGVKELFNNRLRTFTILMMIIFFFLSLGFFGFITVLANILKLMANKGIIKEDEDARGDAINKLILINLYGSFGTILAGIFSEIKGFGRKNTEIYFISGSAFFGTIALIYMRHFNTIMGLGLSLMQSSINIHITYTEEIYPTALRDYASGLLCATTRLGGFASQFIFIYLISLFFLYPVYFYILSCLICVSLICFLPDDNKKALDSYIKLDNLSSYGKNDYNYPNVNRKSS